MGLVSSGIRGKVAQKCTKDEVAWASIHNIKVATVSFILSQHEKWKTILVKKKHINHVSWVRVFLCQNLTLK